MKASEENCRKFKMNHLEWSPKVGVWIRRKRLLQRVGHFLEGRIPDPRNLLRDCKKRGISDQHLITREELGAELLICDQKLEELKLTAPGLRVEHLEA